MVFLFYSCVLGFVLDLFSVEVVRISFVTWFTVGVCLCGTYLLGNFHIGLCMWDLFMCYCCEHLLFVVCCVGFVIGYDEGCLTSRVWGL